MVSFLLLGKGPSLPLFQQGKVTHLDTVGWACVCTYTLLPWAIPQWSRLGSSSQTPSPLASPLSSDAPSVSGLNNGDLVLKDITYKDDGLYQCTVANHVGYSVCVVEVKVSGGCRQWLLGWEGWTEEPGLYFGVSAGSALWVSSMHIALPRSARKPWEKHANMRS